MNDVFGSAAAGFVIFLLIVLVIVLLVVVVNMNMKMNRLQRRYNLFMKGSDGQSVEKAMTSRLREIGKLRSRQERSHEDLVDLQQQYNSMLCKYGIVKYDAFEDVGGKMSFALAMLDQTNTGFVLNAIHSRDNCYLYLKDVVKGASYIMLSDEEVEALRRASRYGEAEVAAAISRRKKRDEERARKEAAEEAKVERKLAAQAAQRRKQALTPEEAELQQLEAIIAKSEKRAGRTAATEEAPQPQAGTARAAARRQAAETAPEESTARAAARRPAQTAEVKAASEMPDLKETIDSVRRAAEIRETAQPVWRPEDEAPQPARRMQEEAAPAPQPVRVEEAAPQPAQEQETITQAPVRRSAAARRIDEGMPELTE